MKNIINILEVLFSNKIENIKITERFDKLIIEGNLKSESSISKDSIELIEKYLKPLNDTWKLMIFLNDGDPYTETHNKIIEEFTTRFKDVRPFEEDLLSFKFILQKSISLDTCNIYCSNEFTKWVDEKSPVSFLKVINKFVKENSFINFNVLEHPELKLFSERIRINDSTFSRKEISNNWEYFHFDNSKDYPYRGDDFKIVSQTDIFDPIQNKLIILRNLFSLTSLLDVTYLSENYLNFQLYGFKHIRGEVDINKLDKRYSIYAEINSWVYSTDSNISDKIGLVRNIISLYKKEGSLEIDKSAYDSILSGYRIYLKENISKYIEVRSKLNDELNKVLQEVKESLNELTNSYQKSNFLYISFFLSVFVLRTMNKVDFQNVFTKDATIMFLSLIAISFVYLIYSVVLVLTNRNRIENRYFMLKAKNTDLMTESDISKILNDDDEFKSELKYADKRIIGFVVLWILTMVIFYIALTLLSESV